MYLFYFLLTLILEIKGKKKSFFSLSKSEKRKTLKSQEKVLHREKEECEKVFME